MFINIDTVHHARFLEKGLDFEFIYRQCSIEGINLIFIILAISLVIGLIINLWNRYSLALKQTQSSLQQREDNILTLMQESIQGTMIAQQYTVHVANQTAATLFGYVTPQPLIGQDIRKLFTPHSNIITEEFFLPRLPRPSTGLSYELQCTRCDGSAVWMLCQVSPILWDSQLMQLFTFTDITAQTQLEQEVLSISEYEQQRLSRDLHDVLGQQLTGITFISKALEQTLKSQHRSEAAKVIHMNVLLQQALGQLRNLVTGLNPVELETDGLKKSLQNLAMNTQTAFGLPVEFRSTGPWCAPESVVGVHLYRIAQEAINNIGKHAQAQHVLVEMASSPQGLQLTIEDDGIGIMTLGRSGNGMGLRSMHYRARLIGAHLTISRSAAGGTQVRCIVPAALRLAA